LTGLTEDQAKKAIVNAKFLVGKPTIEQFDPKIKKGLVVDYLDADGKSLLGQTTYSENRVITLVVSAGPLPNVAGMTVQAAEAALKQVGLTGEPGSAAYSDTVPSGDVVGIDPETNSAGVGRVFRVGDSENVQLITSRGIEMFTVPNVINMTWANAKAALLADDFTLQYSHAADISPSTFTVQSVNPAVGSTQKKGTLIKVKFNGF
jgi:serine/threonine-protein kinase